MAKSDRLKEEIGWLKVVFGLFAALDVSAAGWLARNYAVAARPSVAATGIGASVVTLVLVGLNRLAYRRLNELENA